MATTSFISTARQNFSAYIEKVPPLGRNFTTAVAATIAVAIINGGGLKRALTLGAVSATSLLISRLIFPLSPRLAKDCNIFGAGIKIGLLLNANRMTTLFLGIIFGMAYHIGSNCTPLFKKVFPGDNWQTFTLKLMTTFLLVEAGTRFCSLLLPITPLSNLITTYNRG